MERIKSNKTVISFKIDKSLSKFHDNGSDDPNFIARTHKSLNETKIDKRSVRMTESYAHLFHYPQKKDDTGMSLQNQAQYVIISSESKSPVSFSNDAKIIIDESAKDKSQIDPREPIKNKIHTIYFSIDENSKKKMGMVFIRFNSLQKAQKQNEAVILINPKNAKPARNSNKSVIYSHVNNYTLNTSYQNSTVQVVITVASKKSDDESLDSSQDASIFIMDDPYSKIFYDLKKSSSETFEGQEASGYKTDSNNPEVSKMDNKKGQTVVYVLLGIWIFLISVGSIALVKKLCILDRQDRAFMALSHEMLRESNVSESLV